MVVTKFILNMTSIIINSITGLNYPYDIYVCDVYGNNCAYIANVQTSVPSPIEIVLPLPFSLSPSVGIKIITYDGCVKFKIINCIPYKQFQDYQSFEFMDLEPYNFQN